eukprot:scaffold276794_cov33-Tisochrysis_lutea.AAC.2
MHQRPAMRCKACCRPYVTWFALAVFTTVLVHIAVQCTLNRVRLWTTYMWLHVARFCMPTSLPFPVVSATALVFRACHVPFYDVEDIGGRGKWWGSRRRRPDDSRCGATRITCMRTK